MKVSEKLVGHAYQSLCGSTADLIEGQRLIRRQPDVVHSRQECQRLPGRRLTESTYPFPAENA